MATLSEVKNLLDLTTQMFDSLASAVGLEGDVGKVARFEVGKFMMYLSASDGEIKWSEASAISTLCEMNLSPDTIGEFIRENNIYSIEFEKTVPVTLQLIVKADNILLENNMLEEDIDGPKLLIDLYKYAADCFIGYDGDVDVNEENDKHIYISMMENYINENSSRRKSSVLGFSKNSGNDSAPVKSGVTAPKKG